MSVWFCSCQNDELAGDLVFRREQPASVGYCPDCGATRRSKKIVIDLAIHGYEAAMPDWNRAKATVDDAAGSCGFVDTVEGGGRVTIYVAEFGDKSGT